MALSFKEKIKTLLQLDFKTISALISQRHSGYLFDVGWFNSFKSKQSVDRYNNPIPWVSYPFLDFLNERLNDYLDVFEFGAGNSTLYFASKVNSVTSVEDNKDWYEYLLNKVPANVNLIFRQQIENGNYSKAAADTSNKYHIIFDDGKDRVNSVKNSLNNLHENGVIILDDSEREEYNEIFTELKSLDFRFINFWGIAPTVLFKKCTTVFYRKNNCFDI